MFLAYFSGLPVYSTTSRSRVVPVSAGESSSCGRTRGIASGPFGEAAVLILGPMKVNEVAGTVPTVKRGLATS